MGSSNQTTFNVPEPWNQSHFLKFCPGEYFSTNYSTSSDSTCNDDRTKLDFYTVPAWFNLVSSLIALAGCILILITYHHYPNFQTGSRKIASHLAVSNLFLALGSIVGAINYVTYRYQNAYSSSSFTSYCSAFVIICEVQALITWTSTLASFVWTIVLALFLYLALAEGSITFFSHRYIWWGYYALSFAVPLFVMVPILGAGFLGYSPFSNGAGCFITTAYVQVTPPNGSDLTVFYGYNDISTGLFSFVKGLEVLSYVVVIALFSVILRKTWRGTDSTSTSEEDNQAMVQSFQPSQKWDWRLISIPFVFVFFRIWGTITVFLSIILDYTNVIDSNGCVSKSVYGVFFALAILQAIGDPGQGWGNAILFVFLSPNVRRRLFSGCCQFKKSKLSISHLTSPVDEIDEESGGFGASYHLQPSSTSSLRLPSSASSHSSIPKEATPTIISRGSSHSQHRRKQHGSLLVRSGSSSAASNLFLDD